jgi:hypothetical protein
LVCGECGANYIGNGVRDYVCPAHISNSCVNDMRFRREDAHVAVFDLLREEMLSDTSVANNTAHIECVVKARQRDEDQATREAERGTDLKRLDDEIRALRKMALRPAALAAAIDEIEKERAELLAKAAGKRDRREGRARQLLARMPELVAAYRGQIQQALKVLADDRAVHTAREATRRLLADGRITLSPTPDRTAVTGPVQLVGLGEHMLELAGWQRKPRGLGAWKPSGSGGRI